MILLRHLSLCFPRYSHTETKVDFHFPHDLTQDDVAALSAEVNAVFKVDLSVVSMDMPKDEAALRYTSKMHFDLCNRDIWSFMVAVHHLLYAARGD